MPEPQTPMVLSLSEAAMHLGVSELRIRDGLLNGNLSGYRDAARHWRVILELHAEKGERNNQADRRFPGATGAHHGMPGPVVGLFGLEDILANRESKIVTMNKSIEAQNLTLKDALARLEPAIEQASGAVAEGNMTDGENPLDAALAMLDGSIAGSRDEGDREQRLLAMRERAQTALDAIAQSKPVLPEHNQQLRGLLDQALDIADDAARGNADKRGLMDQLGKMLTEALDGIEGQVDPGAIETRPADAVENNVVSLSDRQETEFNRAVVRLQVMIAERQRLEALMAERETLLWRCNEVIDSALRSNREAARLEQAPPAPKGLFGRLLKRVSGR